MTSARDAVTDGGGVQGATMTTQAEGVAELTLEQVRSGTEAVDRAITHHDAYEQTMLQFGVHQTHTLVYLQRLYATVNAALARADAAERVVAELRVAIALADDARTWFPEGLIAAVAAYDAARQPADGSGRDAT